MKDKRLLFSITKDDFEMQTFSCGGKGGSGKDTGNSGVRLVHRASGATGEGRDERHQAANKKAAFKRLLASERFKAWHRIECARRMGTPVRETPEQVMARVDRMIEDGLRSGQIVVEACGDVI